MIAKMEAYHDGEMWCARGIGEDVFAQGATFDELIENVKEAVAVHYDNETISEVLLLSEVKIAHEPLAVS